MQIRFDKFVFFFVTSTEYVKRTSLHELEWKNCAHDLSKAVDSQQPNHGLNWIDCSSIR